jgi:hypothetical protein
MKRFLSAVTEIINVGVIVSRRVVALSRFSSWLRHWLEFPARSGAG